MCTVSYIPISEGEFILTSNRDERIVRPTRPPVTESIGDTNVFFPKDEIAGGTWIAASDNGRVCCLLNGAFEKHQRKSTYLKSRGKVVLESFEYNHLPDFFKQVDLQNVEPFTLIIWDSSEESKLFEFRWDAINKYLKKLDVSIPMIWSSATLYSEPTRTEREKWFNTWLNEQTLFEHKGIMNFHSLSHGNDPENDLIMKRVDGLKTVSITQVEFNLNSFTMRYYDLLKEQNSSLTKGIKNNLYV